MCAEGCCWASVAQIAALAAGQVQHAQMINLSEEHDADMTNTVDLPIIVSGNSCSR